MNKTLEETITKLSKPNEERMEMVRHIRKMYKRLKCGHYAWQHRPEANFMKIWTCTDEWRNHE